MKTSILLCVSALLMFMTVALADDHDYVREGAKRSITLPTPAVSLKEGAGMDVTRRYCSICHSLDYITTQQKFPRSKWLAEVNKMIKTYGAPVSEENAKTITNYITTQYGTGD